MNRARTILYCDDNPDDLRVHPPNIKNAWTEMFGDTIEIACCTDVVTDDTPSDDACTLTQVGEYDLVLLDIAWGASKQPHGVDIASMIREKYPELPIVVFSEEVTVKDFTALIPLRLSGYLTKADATAQSWCAQIRNVISRECEDTAGQALYQRLRALLARTPSPWCSETVSESASGVWRHDNIRAKWNAFWTPWTSGIADRRLTLAFRNMKVFFADEDLLALSLDVSMRGHLDHVLYVYYTGYLLSHSIPGFQDHVLNATRNLLGSEFQSGETEHYWGMFQFAWLVAATLHDTAYPLEVLPSMPSRANSIMQSCPYAKFDEENIPEITPQRINWKSGTAKSAAEGFRDVLSKLGGRSKTLSWIKKNAKFEDDNERERFNHGVASGIMFVAEAEEWEKLADQPPELRVFNRWAATAMALHAMKKAKHSEDHRLKLVEDPLSWLLAISDELQVWNRNRPNEVNATSGFSRIDLDDIGVSDGTIGARINYSPRTDLADKDSKESQEAIGKITESLQEDNRLLNAYIDPKPMKIEIENVVKKWSYDLPGIVIE